ncbi:hypothetical protein AB1Y20_010382 [Prymnesium parvum]|uniref:Uncharacterized protein n=1 Tax=Prymnesium parvum TaxID=97485 RepID=A0AB34IS06_PRYPA
MGQFSGGAAQAVNSAVKADAVRPTRKKLSKKRGLFSRARASAHVPPPRDRRSSDPQALLTADQLSRYLKEGDVVLFKGTRMPDRLIRCCTNAEYNHVALVVRADNELQLFEATALGVGRCPLEFYVNSFYWSTMSARFHTVAIRRLYTPYGRGISPEMREELKAYQGEIIGHSYKKNPLQYIRPLLHIPQKEDFSSVFCSELIAGAYKRMGLLPEERSANDYLPKDFSTDPRARLPLVNGVRLGREVHIVFGNESAYSLRGLQPSHTLTSERLSAHENSPSVQPKSPGGRSRSHDKTLLSAPVQALSTESRQSSKLGGIFSKLKVPQAEHRASGRHSLSSLRSSRRLFSWFHSADRFGISPKRPQPQPHPSLRQPTAPVTPVTLERASSAPSLSLRRTSELTTSSVLYSNKALYLNVVQMDTQLWRQRQEHLRELASFASERAYAIYLIRRWLRRVIHRRRQRQQRSLPPPRGGGEAGVAGSAIDAADVRLTVSDAQ